MTSLVEWQSQNNGLDVIENQMTTLAEFLPQMETPQVVDVFVKLKQLTSAVKVLETKSREVLLDRKDQGGTDGSGHYLMGGGDTSGLTIQRRVSVTLKEDVVEQLKGMGLHQIIPQKPDPVKMEVILKEMGIDPQRWTNPEPTVEWVEALVVAGVLTQDAALNLLETKETMAFVPKKVVKK